MKIKIMTPFLKSILGNNIVAITLAPFGIYIKESHINNIVTINHEKIHWKQQIELLFIVFYFIYIPEWLIRLIFMPNKAYKSLSFEKEAYDNDQNQDYLLTRKPYSWIKYY